MDEPRYGAFMERLWRAEKPPGMALRHNGPKGPILWRSIPNPEAGYGARYGANRRTAWAAIVERVVENARIARKARVMFGQQP